MFAAAHLCCELAFGSVVCLSLCEDQINLFLMIFPLFGDKCDRDFWQLANVIGIFCRSSSAVHLALVHCQLTVLLIAIFTVIILKIF